jgi:hypothetical protein
VTDDEIGTSAWPSAGVEPTDPEEPVAHDAQTLAQTLHELEQDGYTGEFRVLELGRLQCLTCRNEVAGDEVSMTSLCRLEGASDPADMLAVAALRCPRCGAAGAVVLNYGPDATLEESTLLLGLKDDRPA